MVRKQKEPDANEQAGTETDKTNDETNYDEQCKTEFKETTKQYTLFNNPELPQASSVYELIEIKPDEIKSVKFVRHKQTGILKTVNLTLISQAVLEDLFDDIKGNNVINDNGVLHCGVVNKLKEVLIKC
jgi:Asp-tRNA(Asn)/Glu-tRNA(Gln) amidotransferase B subunit